MEDVVIFSTDPDPKLWWELECPACGLRLLVLEDRPPEHLPCRYCERKGNKA